MARKKSKQTELDKLTYDDIIEHAESLPKKEGQEAISYFKSLYTATVPITDKAKEKEINAIKGKKKKDTNEPFYTEKEIEEKISNIQNKTRRKYSKIKIKTDYCKRFWKEKVPESNKVKKLSIEDKIAAAENRIKLK